MPSLKSGPHGLPVGVVADAALLEKVRSGLEAADPEAFTVSAYGDEAELDHAAGQAPPRPAPTSPPAGRRA